jgi:hypothetical protein
MEQLKKQSAHEDHCAVAQKLTPLHLSGNGGGAKFENPEALETLGLDLTVSFQSQSLTEELEVGEQPVKPDRKRNSARFSHSELG